MTKTFLAHTLGASLFFTLLLGCTNSTKEEVVEQYESGNKKKVITYQINQKSEKKIKEEMFYENGQKRYSGEFSNNKKAGEWKFWYKDGTIWSHGFFKDGLRTGPSRVYHENGNLFYSGTYHNGEKHDEWVFYNEQGQEINRVTFKMGKMVSNKNSAIVPKDTIN